MPVYRDVRGLIFFIFMQMLILLINLYFVIKIGKSLYGACY